MNTPTSDFLEEERRIASFLTEEYDKRFLARKLFQILIGELALRYTRFKASGFELIRERSKALSNTIAVWVEIIAIQQKKGEGKAIDIDPDGALILRERMGAIRRILAGDVLIRSF